MSIKFQTQLSVDNIEDPMLNNMWEVIMPELDISAYTQSPVGLDAWLGYKQFAPIVEEITFAPLGFKNSTDIRAGTTFYNIPLDKLDAKEANLTFYCDKQMKTQFYLKAWKDTIFNEEHEFYYLPYQYKKDIFVYFYGLTETMATTTPVIQYCLKGCYPITQDDITLKYSKNADRLRITQKFNVDRVIVDNYNTNSISKIAKGLGNIASAANPRQVVKNIFSSTFSATGIDYKSQDNSYGIYNSSSGSGFAKELTRKLIGK
jgi:hypothetical protein